MGRRQRGAAVEVTAEIRALMQAARQMEEGHDLETALKLYQRALTLAKGDPALASLAREIGLTVEHVTRRLRVAPPAQQTAAPAAAPAVERASRAVHNAVDDLLRRRETWRRRRDWAIGLAIVTGFVVLIGMSIRNAQIQEMNRQATATAQARATATAQAQATATVQAIRATISAIEANRKVVYGPADGDLEHNAEDKLVSYDGAGVTLLNFVCEVTFYNPYSTSEGSWDYGIFFRQTGGNQEYRLSVQSDRSWELMFVEDPTWDTVASGVISNLDISPGGRNTLRLVVKDDQAFFYVNGVYISTLSVIRKQKSGDVVVATGIWNGDEITGKATRYTGFTVWSLP